MKVDATKAEVLQAISEQLDRMQDFGQLQVSVKKHRGNYSSLDIMHVTSQKFSDNEPNVTAAEQMMTLFRGATLSAKQMGKKTSLGFSMTIDELGHADVMQVSDFKKL